MGPDFGFSSAWDSVTAVGCDFARAMFAGCSGCSGGDRNTFGPGTAWSDYGSLRANWR
jgi:hypothetical protein